jgi:hypothetical protein
MKEKTPRGEEIPSKQRLRLRNRDSIFTSMQSRLTK